MKTPSLATLILAASAATAAAMPLAVPAPLEGPLLQVQDCGPPIRRIQIDPFTGEQRLVWIRRPCGPGYYGGGWAPPRVYEERPYYRPAPRYYEPPPVRYYEEEPVYRPRRPPPPGWERDPYTGRDTRILR